MILIIMVTSRTKIKFLNYQDFHKEKQTEKGDHIVYKSYKYKSETKTHHSWH